MALRPSRRNAPQPLVAALLPGERLLAWAPVAGGGAVGVSTLALYVPEGAAVVRVAHERVAAATWEDPELRVTLVGADHRRYVLVLDDPGEVPPALRERVMATIVLSEHVSLDPGGAGALITARRPPGGSTLSWNVVFDEGLDPADPALRELADQAIAALRVTAGS